MTVTAKSFRVPDELFWVIVTVSLFLAVMAVTGNVRPRLSGCGCDREGRVCMCRMHGK